MENLVNKIKQHDSGTLHLENREYFIDQPIKINNSLNKIHINGNGASITAGKKLTEWEKSGKYYIHKAYDIKYANQLYKNGKNVDRPHTTFKSSGAWDMYDDINYQFYGEKTHQDKIYYDGYLSKNIEMVTYSNVRNLEFIYDVGWTHCICPVENITKVDDTHVFIKMIQPTFRDCQIKEGMQIKSPNQIVNIKELLSKGQWYFDSSNKEIIYYPLDGEKIETLDMIIPVSDELLTIEQSKNITFENIIFSYTSWLKPSVDGLPDGQANLCKDFDLPTSSLPEFNKPASAIRLKQSSDIYFKHCKFINMGCCAIDLDEGVKHVSIKNCTFKNIAANGIMIGQFKFKCGHEEDETLITEYIDISNNELSSIGSVYKSGSAIIASYLRHTTLSHNTIFDVAYTGISLGWGWGFDNPNYQYNDMKNERKHCSSYTTYSIMVDNHIENNHIYNVMSKMHDGAAIYTLSMNKQSTITGNYVHDNGNFKGIPYEKLFLFRIKTDMKKPECKALIERESFPGGIYLDEGSGGFTVDNNVICRVACPFYYHYTGIKGVFETNTYKDNFISDDYSKQAKLIIKNAGIID